jgi:hypothetical protein
LGSSEFVASADLVLSFFLESSWLALLDLMPELKSKALVPTCEQLQHMLNANRVGVGSGSPCEDLAHHIANIVAELVVLGLDALERFLMLFVFAGRLLSLIDQAAFSAPLLTTGLDVGKAVTQGLGALVDGDE